MKKMKRIAAGAATLAMIASMALAMPMTASAEATKYSGIITGSSAKDSALTGSVTYKDKSGTDQIFTSYNAAELKKILVIKDDANIPKVSFDYTASQKSSGLRKRQRPLPMPTIHLTLTMWVNIQKEQPELLLRLNMLHRMYTTAPEER